MKKPLSILAALLLAALGYYQQHSAGSLPNRDATASTEYTSPQAGTVDNTAVERAIAEQARDVQLTLQGAVKKQLPDDNDGSRHQRILVALPSGRTVLIAHNIDLAPRVPDLQPGATIEAYGEFVWNDRGGVLHWTHHDPQDRHEAGWIRYQGRQYQ
jgi:hypothetical protein